MSNYYNAEYKLYDGMGHDMMIEDYWEVVASDILNFIIRDCESDKC